MMQALHFAFFVEKRSLALYLLRMGANFNGRDNYFASPFHYAKLLERIPNIPKKDFGIKLVRHQKVEEISIKEFQEITHSEFRENVVADNDYIEELMFSSISIDNPDMEWRKKFSETFSGGKSGDENVILAFINKKVGHGVFSAKDFHPGDFILKYCGKIERGETLFWT